MGAWVWSQVLANCKSDHNPDTDKEEYNKINHSLITLEHY